MQPYSSHRIGYAGLERMQSGLNLTASLVHLNLSHCDLNDASGKLIATALTTNANLNVSCVWNTCVPYG